jgi:hypothetical protein
MASTSQLYFVSFFVLAAGLADQAEPILFPLVILSNKAKRSTVRSTGSVVCGELMDRPVEWKLEL